MTFTEEDHAEADRLARLPKKFQREAVEMIGSPAFDPNVPAKDRAEAKRRANVLKRLLGLDAMQG